MAYDEGLADRVREAISGYSNIDEIKMFGGLCFTINGNMAVGVVKEDLMIRFDPDRTGAIMAKPHVRPMDFTKRPMRGFAFVGPGGHASAATLKKWVDVAASYVSAMPPKAAKKKKP